MLSVGPGWCARRGAAGSGWYETAAAPSLATLPQFSNPTGSIEAYGAESHGERCERRGVFFRCRRCAGKQLRCACT
jgi:hypothetical protein